MGLQGRPWNDCKGEEKKALRKRFDQIKTENTTAKSEAAGLSRLERELDAIGVIPRRG